MRCLSVFVAVILLSLGLPAAAEPPPGWTNNFEAAKSRAQSSSRDLLLNFTGSDWATWSEQLEEEVFLHPSFEFIAPESFVLVHIDFPSYSDQNRQIRKQNDALAERFDIEGFPTVVLADAEGRPYAVTGYVEGGPDAYMRHLDELVKIRVTRDAAMERGRRAEGLDRARAYDEALEAVGAELAMKHYRDVIEQILGLDMNDEAGLRTKYQQKFIALQFEEQIDRAMEQYQRGDKDGAQRALNALLTKANLPTEMKQVILAIRGRIYLDRGDDRGGRDQLHRAIEVDPESDIAREIREFIAQRDRPRF